MEKMGRGDFGWGQRGTEQLRDGEKGNSQCIFTSESKNSGKFNEHLTSPFRNERVRANRRGREPHMLKHILIDYGNALILNIQRCIPFVLFTRGITVCIENI